MKIDHLIIPHTRINSKWIRGVNVRPETIKTLGENKQQNFYIAYSNILSDISPQARETKEKYKQMGLHQTKKVLHSEGNHQQDENSTH